MHPAAGNIDISDSTIFSGKSPQASSLVSSTEARGIFLLFGTFKKQIIVILE